jgi:hypothetical protein
MSPNNLNKNVPVNSAELYHLWAHHAFIQFSGVMQRSHGMKKIVLISASVFALGAASIAADAGGIYYPLAIKLTSASASPVGENVSLRGERVVANPFARNVRHVSSNVEPVNSCDAAYWPYYPGACLERTEAIDL